VQLPGFIYADREDDKSWCVIRQAQDDAHKSLKDVGMACIIDCGEFNEIHPSDKEAVGERVYRQMLYVAYKMMDKSEAEAPGVLEIKADGDGVTVRFDCEELELKGKSERGIGGFRLAGDGEFYDAYASLINKNTVRVTCPEVKKPEKISYLWDNYPPEINLYSKSALPVKPFTGAVKRG
jgi:sialate O-acetylesterase